MLISQENQERAKELLEKLTLEEKLGMIHGAGLFRTAGVKRLGIPPLKMSDGPMGVRREYKDDSWEGACNTEDYVTYLPSNSAIASTWNRELACRSGQVLGEEARGRGKDVILAPGINIKRSPLCGRNFEYMSEDPYLTAGQCVPLIQGIQENDVAACVKHFAANNQETNRLWVDVSVSEKALYEIYFPAFKAAVQKGGALSVMGAYNLLNGVRCCESRELLDRVLRDEWRYDGLVISDWGGILRTKESAGCSMDIEMSIQNNFDDYCFARPLKEAVEQGRISEAEIDKKVRRILGVMLELHMLGGKRKSGCYSTPKHRQAALDVARESIVLLKNKENLLPLNPEETKRLLVIGDNGDRLHAGGGGSAEIKALYEISPLMGLRSILGGNTEVTYVKGYDVPHYSGQMENWQENSLQGGDGKSGEKITSKDDVQKRRAYREEAVRLAKEYENVIFIGGLNHDFDLEDQDRQEMKLPYGQDEVLEAVLDANPNTIVVMCAGSPVEMERWADKAKAIVWNWYNGMEGGTALAEVLLGKVNPSGKLPETFPRKLADCSAHSIGEFGKCDGVRYDEGIFVGYRHYDKRKIPVRFCFGHGLSYTTFAYSSLTVDMEPSAPGLRVRVSFGVTNQGTMAGKEIVQVYTGFKGDGSGHCPDYPMKELKGYDKVFLEPGETRRVVIWLSEDAFAHYDEEKHAFAVEKGKWEIYIGASAEDIRLRETVDIKRRF